MEKGKEYQFGDIRTLTTDVASILVKMGYRKDADAWATFAQIVGYKVGDNFSDSQTALETYEDNCKRIEEYIKKPSI